MRLTKKQRIKKKQVYIKNKKLCKEYPFLIPRNRWTGKIYKNYDYSYTELDGFPRGWYKRAIQCCKEMKPYLIKANYLDKLQILQCKEKFGSARMYTGGIPVSIADQVNDCINRFEMDSEEICVSCGRSAKMCDYNGWLSPYCEKCLHKVWDRANDYYMKYSGYPYKKGKFDYNMFVCKEENDE